MLNKSKGQMYEWVTHTWNTCKGECPHNCGYCYMKRFGQQRPLRFDEKELKTDLGKDNFIFVGSSCDMFANLIPEEWIKKTLEHCDKYDNSYLFQTKNPKGIRRILPEKSVVCVTLETNRMYHSIMRSCPTPQERVNEMKLIRHPLYITIEPIMSFDLKEFVTMIKDCGPIQCNIGSDSGGHDLPEPWKEDITKLISELSEFTKVKIKKNLKRIWDS